MRSSFHFISGDRHLSPLGKGLYRASHLLEKMINTNPGRLTFQTYRPTFDRDRYVAAFGQSALDLSSARVLCLNFLLDHGRDVFSPTRSVANLGCGSGRYADFLRNTFGYRAYAGYDVKSHPEWKDRAAPSTRFSIAELGSDLIDVSASDLIFSQSVLEHVKEDKSVFCNFTSKKEKTVQHLHFVPAIGSYEAYGPHGYRRYGPRQIRNLLKVPGISNLRLHAIGSRLTRAMAKDHARKLSAGGFGKWTPACPVYAPDLSIFDNLSRYQEHISPSNPYDAEYYALMFDQIST